MPSSTDSFAVDQRALDVLFHQARSVRFFADTPVSDQQIRALYELTKFGPTSLNCQPMRVVLARSSEARERVISHLWDANKAKAASAPLIAVLAADTEFHEHLPRLIPHYVGIKDTFADPTMRAEFARSQAWLQVGYFIVGVRALGLSAGPIGGLDAAALDADLFAGSSLRSLLVVNIGHPGPEAFGERLPRLDFDEAVRSI
jgi:3-hydroxypropanoate dehydrogenase